MPSVAHDVLALSSGTLATLTGASTPEERFYSRLDAVQQECHAYVLERERDGHEYESWYEAWADFERACRRDGRKLEGDRLTVEFKARSTRRLDSGSSPISESPLFGGPAQGELF